MIVPQAVFNCSGRVTRIAASLANTNSTYDLPIIQIWRPSSSGSGVYNKIIQVKLTDVILMKNNYCIASITISDISETEFQLGDVIGYYQPSDSIWNIQTDEYTSYTTDGVNNSITAINISDLAETNRQQPLIQVLFGKNYFLS